MLLRSMLYRTHRLGTQRLDAGKVGSRQAINLGNTTLGYMRILTLMHFQHHLHFTLFVIWLEPLPCLHLNPLGH